MQAEEIYIYESLKKNESESQVNEIEHILSDKGKRLESTYRKGI